MEQNFFCTYNRKSGYFGGKYTIQKFLFVVNEGNEPKNRLIIFI